jgi:hypothetical protein
MLLVTNSSWIISDLTCSGLSRVAQSVQCLTTNWTAGVRSPTEAEDFSSNLCVQTGCGPTQPPTQWVPGALSPGVKRGRGLTLTTHALLVPRLRKSRGYTSCHPDASLWSARGPLCLLHLLAYLMNCTNRKIAYCDTVWNNRRKTPKFWTQCSGKERWDIIGSDDSNVTAVGVV